MQTNTIIHGDIREVARRLESGSINCIVTSPPYWGLRDYGVADQLGLEETPEQYVANLVSVFRELRRALRDDGTVWLNLGDSYAGNNSSNGEGEIRNLKTEKFHGGQAHLQQRRTVGNHGLKPKDLCMIPARVALALQADGWWLRSDIIWAKSNPMPESVTDRPTKSHEYIFLLTKRARYWYDAEAVREAHKDSSIKRMKSSFKGVRDRKVQSDPKVGNFENYLERETGWGNPNGRNRRSVWTIATKPYSGAHFAVFPPDLVRPCILAGCPHRVCSECGAPWVRVVEKTVSTPGRNNNSLAHPEQRRNDGDRAGGWEDMTTKTLGHRPACTCHAPTVPGVVLDPFFGSGTVAQVAIENGRDWLGVELNEDYIKLANKRLAAVQQPLFVE